MFQLNWKFLNFSYRSASLLLVLLIAATVSLTSCSDTKPTLKNGIWKSSLQRKDGQVIVFNFETKDSAGQKVLYVLNGSEKLLVDQIEFKGDSIFIEMPFFDSGFAAKVDQDGNLEGVWIKKGAGEPQLMPFHAVHNQSERFPVSSPANQTITGRWAVTFTNTKNQVTDAVGEFEQTGQKLTGTFLTATGDYRYLEGVVSGDSLKLSGFDGGHAFLFTARISDAATIRDGRLFSGPAVVEKWSAKKDIKAELPDGYSETTLRPGENTLNFRFNSTDDKSVSITDDNYKGKVVIIQILGSWCPNCMDETKFLSDYYTANRDKGVEIIGLAYERTTDLERSKKALTSFQNRFKVNYPILITGVAVTDSLRTEKTLPQINKIKAFPTSIFIDKKGIVRKIYTGFTGPGTGSHYEAFRKEFDDTVVKLIQEKT